MLTLTTGFLTALVYYNDQLSWLLVVGLILFGALFAMNSSIHSYLIVRYSNAENVSMDVGFYYMANAMGRLTAVWTNCMFNRINRFSFSCITNFDQISEITTIN